jgi:PKD repeat protein
MNGARIQIPADAALGDIDVHVGYELAAPGAFRTEAISAGATTVSKTLVVNVANGGPTTFNKLVTITIPYDTVAANGLPPAVLYWDQDANRYRAVSVIGLDRDKGTVTFQSSHFSRFTAVVVKALGTSAPPIDTGFRLRVNSILSRNFGSYSFGGHCMAFASMSVHYFSLKKTNPLFDFAQEGIIQSAQGATNATLTEVTLDDELTRTALSFTYSLLANKWDAMASSVLPPNRSESDTGWLMIYSMILTGDPVFLYFGGGGTAHAVVVYAYDATNAQFKIYDSNFPLDEQTFNWTERTGFGSYSISDGTYRLFNQIGYASDATFGSPSEFQKIISDWETGKLQDYFSHLSLIDQSGVTRLLSYASAVIIDVPTQGTQTITGHFNKPNGSADSTYLHIFVDGKREFVSAPVIASSGSFTLTFSPKLTRATEILLFVSDNPKRHDSKLYAFGKFYARPANSIPVANFTTSASAASPNQVISFNPVASADSDGSITTYAWDFGDGQTSSGSTNTTVTHSYAAAGAYVVTLTVTDNQGATNIVTATVSVTALAPSVSGISPTTATVSTLATFTVTGQNLPLTAVMALAGGACQTPSNQSSVAFTVVCTPGAVAGSQIVTISTAVSGGTVIDASRSITVSAASVPPPPSTATGLLPDTGVTANQCYQAGSDVLVSCTSAGAIALNAQQDGMIGRDVSNPDNADGNLGFSYSTVGNYPVTDCVKDNITGLMWEGKPATGLRAASNMYTNFDDPTAAQIWDGTAHVNPTQEQIDAATNTVGYKNTVNASALCGYTDWRLPTVDELQSLVDYSRVVFPKPTIDITWFPNTANNLYWSASAYVTSTYVPYPVLAWYIDFGTGRVDCYIHGRSQPGRVRLVR